MIFLILIYIHKHTFLVQICTKWSWARHGISSQCQSIFWSCRLAAAQPTSRTNILCDFSKINEVHREDPWGGWRGKLKPLTYISWKFRGPPMFLWSPYRYQYFKEIIIDIFQNCLINIDIFQNYLIDINLFQKCRYIDNRYFISL